MADPRIPRDLVARDKTVRAVYVPPSALPDPTPEPGMSFRWIATHVLNQANPANVSKQMREGWEPVKAVDHPEMMYLGSTAGNVEIGGLMLCKMPTDRVEARGDYYNRQAATQMESVENNFMRNNDPRMPLFEDKKSTSTRGNSGFGTGSK